MVVNSRRDFLTIDLGGWLGVHLPDSSHRERNMIQRDDTRHTTSTTAKVDLKNNMNTPLITQ